jgi:HK97 family phage prohead protease
VRASPNQAEGEIRFEGYAALFNSWSEDLGGFREQVAPGAFTKALVTDDVRALVNHNPDMVLGRNRSGTLTLTEDERGLHFDVVAPDTQWARDLRESVKRGDINQCSFGFLCLRDDWRTADGKDERTLLECRLFDVSIVTYPAYESTQASARDIYHAHKEARHSAGFSNVATLKRKLDLKEKELKFHE